MKTLLLYTLAFLFSATARAELPELPGPAQRLKMFTQMASEMIRLDGEALLVRERNRNRNFIEVVNRLETEALSSENWNSFLRAFARLNFAYPNLHSKFKTGNWFPARDRVRPAIGFGAEWLLDGTTDYRVSRVSSGKFSGQDAPEIGDFLIAINGRDMGFWKREHLEFCKFPLPQQCDLELFSEFREEILPWTREDALNVTLERNGRRWNIAVPLEPRPPSVQSDQLLCKEDHELYPDFNLVHEGRFACLYQLKSDPGTVLLRISSFVYSRGDQSHPIRTMMHEVNAFWDWWKTNAPSTRHLVIDLASNGGGNAPIPYYAVLFDHPFQELHARFKKIEELDNEKLRQDTIFWGEGAQEGWFQNIKREGIWSATPWGDFLPPVPMFCADTDDCRKGLFPVRNSGFQGKVSLVVNHWCVSSCDGFAYAVKQEFGDRVTVVGQPQAADSAYSRVTINLLLDPKDPRGFRTEIVPLRDPSSENALFYQTVTVSRSTDSTGRVMSGLPLYVNRFVPWTFDQDERAWRKVAVREALKNN